MSTLSIENRENLIGAVKKIFVEHKFEGCCQQISALVWANYSDCIESLTEEQRKDLIEHINHVNYSIDMHKSLSKNSHHHQIPKEALEIEIMAILRDWPVF